MTSSSWPTQLTLPGQSAAPEGPVDMRNMYLFHHAFRRDLDRFVSAVGNTPLDERDTWQLLAKRWAFFAGQLHHHHEAEDRVLWPWLNERVTPDEKQVLDAMQAEHQSIDPALAAVADGFATLAERADDDARTALSASLADLRRGVDEHLAHEESEAMAILQRVTKPEEWATLEKAFSKGQPPGAVIPMVPWVAYGIDPVELRRIMAGAPAPMRLLLRMAGPRFARREARTFVHA